MPQGVVITLDGLEQQRIANTKGGNTSGQSWKDLEGYVLCNTVDTGFLILFQLFRSGSCFWEGSCIIEDIYGYK